MYTISSDLIGRTFSANNSLNCYFSFPQSVIPILYNVPRNEEKCTETRVTMTKSLDLVESYFLKDKKFVGGDEISIADLSFLGEVTQYWMVDCDIYKGRPNMERWMSECQKALSPHFETLLKVVRDIRDAGTYSRYIDVGQAE